MNDKLNYSDLNRFLVSLGILLIVLAFGLPVLVLQNNYEIIIEQEKFDKLTYFAQNMIETKQLLIQVLVIAIPVCSTFFFLFGIIAIYKGMKQWLRRQSIEDEKYDAEKTKVKAEISRINAETLKINLDAKSLTDQQLMKKNMEEIENENIGYSEKEKGLLASQYLLIEKLIYEKLQAGFSNTYNLLPNQMIKSYEFDLILSPKKNSSKINLVKEIILEIKFLNNYSGRVINSAFEHTKTLSHNYPNKIPKAYLLIVCANQEVKELSQARIEVLRVATKDNKKISVKLLTVHELISLKANEIIS